MPFPSIQHTIGFSSARAGIGRTTLVVELAAWFAAHGTAVALLDAELWAPDAAGILGARGEFRETNGAWEPIEAHAVACFSLGQWLAERGLSGVRGELLEQRLGTLLDDRIRFGARELLLVDLPIGAEADEELLEDLGIDALVWIELEGEESRVETARPVLGRIETLARGQPPAGSGRGKALLASIPFDPELRSGAGSGMPLVLRAPGSPAARAIARAGANLERRVASRL